MIPKIECAKLTGSLTPIHFQFVYERIRRKAITERIITNIMNDKWVMYQILLPSNFFLGNRNLKYLAINIPVVPKNIQENIIIIPWDFAFAKDFSSPALIRLSTADKSIGELLLCLLVCNCSTPLNLKIQNTNTMK